MRRYTRHVIAMIIGLVALLSGGSTASAHTAFESSDPADGATIDQPVDVVTIVFTGEANPVGDQFVALTPDGVVQEPVSIDTVDDRTFAVTFDPPLAGGQVGLRWNVQAADAHPIEGAFSFTVTAPVPTTAPAPTTTQPQAIVEEDSTDAAASVPAEDDTVATTEAPSLDEFLAVDNSTPGETTATVGRVVGFLGVGFGIGTFAFLATAMRGRRDEVRQLLTAVRILGVVIAVGAAIEYVGVARIGAESLGSAWSTAPGFATVLRILGGVALAIGVAGSIARGRTQQPGERAPFARSLSSAVIGDAAIAQGEERRRDRFDPVVRWIPDSRSWFAFAGVVLVIVSFWFDGHTVSKGFRPLHAVVNSVHVAAGSVWVGGVTAMAVVAWMRYRDAEPMRMVELVVRFSRIATIALASVVVAGGVMAFLVLDSFDELTGTTWGQILLLKTAAVGLAAIGGAYNHFRLLPALEADPDSPDIEAELRSILTAEAIMLTFVVMVTAWLVAAAS